MVTNNPPRPFSGLTIFQCLDFWIFLPAYFGVHQGKGLPWPSMTHTIPYPQLLLVDAWVSLGFMSREGIGCSSTLTSMTPLQHLSVRQWVLHRVLHTSRNTLKKPIRSWTPRWLASTSTTRVLEATWKPLWRLGTRFAVSSAWRSPSPKGSEIVGPKQSLASALTTAWGRAIRMTPRRSMLLGHIWTILDQRSNKHQQTIHRSNSWSWLINDTIHAAAPCWALRCIRHAEVSTRKSCGRNGLARPGRAVDGEHLSPKFTP